MNVWLWLIVVIFSNNIIAAELTVVVNSATGKPLQGMVVYVTSPDHNYPKSSISSRIEIKQLNKAFSPYISVIRNGAEVNFVNNDKITHHIYSVSGTNQFSFKISAQRSNTLRFSAGEQAEQVSMGCNIHDWMVGYLLVVNTPFYGGTDKSGQITFSLPKGSYQISVWHPQLQVEKYTQSVGLDLAADQILSIKMDKPLLEIPEQLADDDFEFLGNDSY